MTPSRLLNIVSNVSESVGLHPNVVVCILIFLILILISTAIILLKLRKAERVLSAVEREMDAFDRSLEQSSSGIISPNILPSKGSPAINSKEDLPPLKNDSGLKEKIHDLIRNHDHSISLNHLVKALYQKKFDGNYNPILSELDQLEREGEIEGQIINGKVFFRLKQKSPRKYTIKKGKNFRKYFDQR